MNSTLTAALKAFLWFICAFHVIVGIGLNVSSAFPQVMAEYYGAQVTWTPEFLYIVKPIGAFMIAIGVMAAAAARDPAGHRSIVYGIAVLFALRGIQRIVFQDEIGSAVAIEASRNLVNAIFFLAMAVALILLFRMSGSTSENPA